MPADLPTGSLAPHAAPARLALRGIRKSYPGVCACDDIHLQVAPGALHAVLGENGAGKSTLMKIIYGLVQPDGGHIVVDGQDVVMATPADARARGIAMVFQHFSLFESMTAAENVWLGLDAAMSLSELRRHMQETAAHYGLKVDPERPVHTLSVGERQRLEIVRALMCRPRLLILDEPTSVLTPQDAERLFVMLRQLAAEGCSVLYISHKLEEIRALCTHCTVLRAGRVVADFANPAEHSAVQLARLMMGGDLPPAPPRRGPTLALSDNNPAWDDPATRLAVRGLSLAPSSLFGTPLHGIFFALRGGEILGVAGVSGSGQAELLAALSGEDRRAPPGSVWLLGQDVSARGPHSRRRLGQHFVPEERLGRGAVPAMSLTENTLLTRREAVGRGGWIVWPQARAMAERLIAALGVKAAGPEAPAQSLSGGNLQKFIVARELDAGPEVLIIAQPTWGVDVGAAAQIRAALMQRRDAGCAILLVSEELDELLELADRIVVMARGQMSPPIARAAATPEHIGHWMAGGFLSAQGSGQEALHASA